MSHGLVADPRFLRVLLDFDHDLARGTQRQGCPCGGRLHRADYPRKPRGGPPALPPDYARRFSFCCDTCRRRATPPSVRFLGRRLYLAAVVVLVSALRHGPTPARLAKLRDWFGITARTLARWRQWWRRGFPQTAVWRRLRGRLLPAPDVACLPASWMACYQDPLPTEALQWVLAWLMPLTTAAPLPAPWNLRVG